MQGDFLVSVGGCDVHNRVLDIKNRERIEKKEKRFFLLLIFLAANLPFQKKVLVCQDSHSGASRQPSTRPSCPKLRSSGKGQTNSTLVARESLMPENTKRKNADVKISLRVCHIRCCFDEGFKIMEMKNFRFTS